MTEQGKAPAARRPTILPLPLGGHVAGFDFSHGPYGTLEIETDEPFSTNLGPSARVLLVPDEQVYRAAPALADELERLIWEGGLGGFCRRCAGNEPHHKPGCQLVAALRAAGLWDEPQVSAAEPPQKAVEIPAIPDSKG